HRHTASKTHTVMCTYTHKHKHAHMHRHTHTNTNMHTYTNTNMHKCRHTYSHTIHTHTHTHNTMLMHILLNNVAYSTVERYILQQNHDLGVVNSYHYGNTTGLQQHKHF